MLKPLIDVLDGIENEVAKANNQISIKTADLGTGDDSLNEENRYSNELSGN